MKKKQPHEEDKKPTPGNIHDALIATTAAMEADVLVTEDRRLRNRAKLVKPTMHVWNFTDLESYLANF
jgi:predicted nucleic acid-binding protein